MSTVGLTIYSMPAPVLMVCRVAQRFCRKGFRRCTRGCQDAGREICAVHRGGLDCVDRRLRSGERQVFMSNYSRLFPSDVNKTVMITWAMGVYMGSVTISGMVWRDIISAARAVGTDNSIVTAFVSSQGHGEYCHQLNVTPRLYESCSRLQ